MSLVTQEVASNMIKYNKWSEIAQLRLSRKVWKSLCDMIVGKRYQSLVSLGNKMF